MRLRLSLVCLLSVVVLAVAQAPVSYQVPVWDGQRYTWPRLGAGLRVEGDEISVVFPPPPLPVQRVYGTCLTYDAPTTSWGTLPAGATNRAIYFNGMRLSGVEFTIVNGRFTPKAPWKPGAGCLIVDYDLPLTAPSGGVQ